MGRDVSNGKFIRICACAAPSAGLRGEVPGAPKLEHVDRREVQWAEIFLGELEEMAFLAELGGELVGDESTVLAHRVGDAGQDFVSRLFFDHGKGDSRDDVITVRMSESAKRLLHMEGIGLEDCDARVACKLLFQVGGEGGVELKEDELRVGIHPFDNLPGMATFARAKLHHQART